MDGTSKARDSSDNLAQAMTRMIDQILQERDNVTSLDKAIERIVDAIGCFNGKEVTQYLKIYKTEMCKKGISQARLVTSSSRVATSSLYSQVLEIQVASQDWRTFEQALLEEYGFYDSSWIMKKDLMDWVESFNKKLSTSGTFHEFE